MTTISKSPVLTKSFGDQRKFGNEVELTSEVNRLCSLDSTLAHQVARAVLVVAAAARPGVKNDALSGLPNEVRLTNEVPIGPKKSRRMLRSTGGRLDWQFDGDQFCLIVEVKVGAALGADQLERYLNYQSITDRSVPGGLVLLTRDRSPISTKVAKNKNWLGQISWRELLPELEKVEPADRDVSAQWEHLIKVVQQPGDLFADGATWQRKGRTVGQRNCAILRAARDSACEFLDVALSTKLSGRPEGRCGTRLGGKPQRDVTHRDGRASMTIYAPPKPKRAKINVAVTGSRQPLKVTITVERTKFAFGRKDLEQQQRNLCALGFAVAGEAFTVTDSISQGETECTPTIAIQKLLKRRLGQIVESGALDR